MSSPRQKRKTSKRGRSPEKIPPTKKRRLISTTETDGLKRCLSLLKKLMKLPLATEFNQPLDWEYWKLWEYPKIVKHPMDLESVKTFLENGEIVDVEHFYENVKLTFENAKRFNHKGSAIWNAANALMFFFESKFEDIDLWVQDGERPSPIDFIGTEFTGKDDLDPKVLEVREEMKRVKEEIEARKKSIAKLRKDLNRPEEKDITFIEPIAPFTFEEREEICTKMELLTQEDINGLVEIVNDDESIDDDEFEIDLETMDDYTVSKVKEYVEKCIVANGKAVNTEEKLQLAKNETNERILHLQRQLKGVLLSKDLSVGMYVAVDPAKDQESQETFWIGRVASLPIDATVKVQWFELEEITSEDERYYRLTNKADVISVLSVFFSVSVYLVQESDKKLYKLSDYKRTVDECKNYSIDTD